VRKRLHGLVFHSLGQMICPQFGHATFNGAAASRPPATAAASCFHPNLAQGHWVGNLPQTSPNLFLVETLQRLFGIGFFYFYFFFLQLQP